MADIFLQTLKKLDLPGAVASSFPELMPKTTRDRLHSHGIPALQGVEDGLAAIARVMQYNIFREQLLTQSGGADQILIPRPLNTDGISIDEWESKKQLSKYGLQVPDGRLVSKDQVEEAVTAPISVLCCISLLTILMTTGHPSSLTASST
jgi:acyl-CoA synthetase (NDP forming)